MSDENQSEPLSPTRRRLVAAVGTAGVASLAGCETLSSSGGGDASNKDVPPPEVNAADRWQLTTPDSEPRVMKEGNVGVDYEAIGHIRQYEDTRLRNRIKQETFGEVDRPFAAAFAARVDIFPEMAANASGLFGGEISNALRSQLRSAMKNFGVQGVQQQADMSANAMQAGSFQVITGEYPIEPVSIDAGGIPYSDRDELEFGGGALPIKGIIGRWKDDGSIMAGGAVYPNGPFMDQAEVEMSDAISLTLDIDLRLRPRQREQQALSFVDGISK